MARYTLTVRRRGAVDRDRHDLLDDALAALEARLDDLVAPERRGAARGLGRDYAPVQQVALRGEISGPAGLRGGVDVRGDGSAEAYTGRLRRRLVQRRSRETPHPAPRRPRPACAPVWSGAAGGSPPTRRCAARWAGEARAFRSCLAYGPRPAAQCAPQGARSASAPAISRPAQSPNVTPAANVSPQPYTS